jgi:DNA modification methylase
MGSAPVGVAAIAAGHSYIGIEKDADYYEIASRPRIGAKPAHPASQSRSQSPI